MERVPPPASGRVFRAGLSLHPWAAALLVAAALAVAVAAVALFAASQGTWEVGLAALLALATLGYVPRLTRATLACDAAGLRFESGAPWPLSLVSPGWKLAWTQIRRASWSEGLGVGRLHLETASGRRTLVPHVWQVDADEALRCERAFLDYRMGRVPILDVGIYPLVRAMREQGVAVPRIEPKPRASPRFDLAGNPATRRVLVATSVAGAAWFIDALLSDQAYAGRPPWMAIIAPGLAAAVLAARFQAKHAVPFAANAFLSALAAAAVALAAHGALLRLNQAADPQGPREVVFTLLADGTLRSGVAGVADLPPRFLGDSAYWQSQPPGSRHRFHYYRGLGFATLDLAEYRLRVHLFERDRRADPALPRPA